MADLDNHANTQAEGLTVAPSPAAGIPDSSAEGDACCGGQHGYSADRARYLTRLKRIEGQVRGIQRMISEDQYCIDILTQMSAINSALENVGLALLEDHLHHCVAGAIADGGELADDKVTEAMAAVKRMVKS